MACPSRETFSVIVVGILLLSVIVCLPVLLIGGLAIIHRVSVSVEDVSLDTFATTLTPMENSTSPPPTITAAVATVTYNLSMVVRVHNPNWFLGVYFDLPLEVRYSFDAIQYIVFRVLLTSEGEKLPAGITRVYCPTTSVAGWTVPLGVDSVADLARQSTAGVFEVHMVVAGNYTERGAKRSIAASCALKLPLGAPPASSKKVKCL